MAIHLHTRHILIALLVLALASCASGRGDRPRTDTPHMAQSGRGHVAFFFLAGMEYQSTREAYGEFVYGYESSKKGLLSEGYSYSYHSSLPLAVENGNLKLTLSKRNLSEGAGLVFIKSRNRFRIVYGVYSGEAIVKMAREYFRRRP